MGKVSSIIKNGHLNLLEKTNNAKKKAITETIDSLIKEEYDKLQKEAEKRSDEIGKKLEELRKTLVKEGQITLRERGSARQSIRAIPERRIPIATISEILDIPINELTLYFLNGQRIHEGAQLVEYRLGCVYFYDMSNLQLV